MYKIKLDLNVSNYLGGNLYSSVDDMSRKYLQSGHRRRDEGAEHCNKEAKYHLISGRKGLDKVSLDTIANFIKVESVLNVIVHRLRITVESIYESIQKNAQSCGPGIVLDEQIAIANGPIKSLMLSISPIDRIFHYETLVQGAQEDFQQTKKLWTEF